MYRAYTVLILFIDRQNDDLIILIKYKIFKLVFLGHHIVLKVLHHIGIIRLILVSVSKWQISDMFNNANVINKYRAILTQKLMIF